MIQTAFRPLYQPDPAATGNLVLGQWRRSESYAAAQCDALPGEAVRTGEANAWRAENLTLAATVSGFETPSFKFRINLLGELNVRNALGVVAAARHCGLKNHQIQEACLITYQRRQAAHGSRRASAAESLWWTTLDIIPLAIRETLRALRVKFKGQENLGVSRAADQHNPAECFSNRISHRLRRRRCGEWFRQVARLSYYTRRSGWMRSV